MTTTTPPVSVGDEMPTVHVEITRADLRRYAEASGDHNPIHLRDEAARELGLPGVVAHGMLTSALVIGEVARWAGGADRVLATDPVRRARGGAGGRSRRCYGVGRCARSPRTGRVPTWR